ncbi:MFP1 attachment factor 1 [Bienertia sinuspersici]
MADTTTNESPATVEISHSDETHQQGQPQQQELQQPQSSAENLTSKLEKMNISSSSFSIWPPTQRTREAVVNRLIETLSTPSVLSKRYGSMLPEEASSTAKTIEEEAYNVAVDSVGDSGSASSSIDEGIEILQVYSKEISKKMLEAVKSRASASADADAAPQSDRATVASEDVSSSIDNESST